MTFKNLEINKSHIDKYIEVLVIRKQNRIFRDLGRYL